MVYAFGPGRKLSQLAASIDLYRAARDESLDIITVFLDVMTVFLTILHWKFWFHWGNDHDQAMKRTNPRGPERCLKR
jgi:hypothetical protein